MQFFKQIATAIVLFFSHSGFSQQIGAEFLTQLEPLQQARLVVTPEDTHKPLHEAFASAKKSIKVGIFSISSKEMTEQLVKARQRGIAVTVICDSNCTKSPSKVVLIDQLKANGVEFYTATKGFSISHWKMFIIDEQLAYISTMNWVTREEQMRDLGVFVTNPSIIKEILEVYNQDIENAKNQTAITPALTQPNLVWSPINAEAKLISLINSAQSTIEIWIENMGNTNVHAALKAAIERKVKVRLLTSQCGLGMPPSAHHPILKQLESFGIDVRGAPYPATTEIPYIHAKTITVDHKTTFIGSENFSFNSLLKARELGIIFEDVSIKNRMTELFEKDWSTSTPIPAEAPKKCEALTYIPPTEPPPTPPVPAPTAE
ncbi:hypothetical protein K2P97_04875 [bacterium]|nr:hypothetical protein [bacterium]